MSVQEMKAVVASLSAEELAKFSCWFEEAELQVGLDQLDLGESAPGDPEDFLRRAQARRAVRKE